MFGITSGSGSGGAAAATRAASAATAAASAAATSSAVGSIFYIIVIGDFKALLLNHQQKCQHVQAVYHFENTIIQSYTSHGRWIEDLICIFTDGLNFFWTNFFIQFCLYQIAENFIFGKYDNNFSPKTVPNELKSVSTNTNPV